MTALFLQAFAKILTQASNPALVAQEFFCQWLLALRIPRFPCSSYGLPLALGLLLDYIHNEHCMAELALSVNYRMPKSSYTTTALPPACATK